MRLFPSRYRWFWTRPKAYAAASASRSVSGCVEPTMPGLRQRRFQGLLVAHARQPAVLSELVGVDRVDDETAEPPRFATLRHRLLRQLAQGCAVFLGGPGGNRQRAFGALVVGGQQNATIGFDRQDPVPRFEAKPVGHVFRQRGANGAAGLSERHFLGHEPSAMAL